MRSLLYVMREGFALDEGIGEAANETRQFVGTALSVYAARERLRCVGFA